MTKATTYNWDYLPEKHEKPGEFKPYKIKGDIIQALKTNRDIELESYNRRLNEGLANMNLEAKEQEMNLRAVNNAKKINEDRDLDELQMMTEAGKQLVLMGMKEWNKSQVRAGARRWNDMSAEDRQKYLAEYDEAWDKYTENRDKFKNFEQYLKQSDPSSYQMLRSTLKGLHSPGIAELQRNQLISSKAKAQYRYKELLNKFEIPDPADPESGNMVGWADLRLREDEVSKLKVKEWETAAWLKTEEYFEFLGGTRIADRALIEKYITPELTSIQRADNLDQIKKLDQKYEEEAKQQRQEYVSVFLKGHTGDMDIDNKSRQDLQRVFVAHQDTNLSDEERKAAANDQIAEIMADMVINGSYDHEGRLVEKYVNSVVEYKTDKKTKKQVRITVRDKQYDRFIKTGVIQAIDDSKKKHRISKSQRLATETVAAQEKLRGLAEGSPNGYFENPEDAQKAIGQIIQPLLSQGLITLEELPTFVQNLQTTASTLTTSGQDISQKYVELTTGPLYNRTISLKEAQQNNYPPDLIEMLETSGHVVKSEGEFTQSERDGHPRQIYNEVYKVAKNAGPAVTLKADLTMSAIQGELNRLTKQYMRTKAQGGLDLDFGKAYKQALFDVRDQAIKEARMDSATLRREGKLLYQRPPSFNENEAGARAKLSVKNYRNENRNATLTDLINANAFVDLDPHISQVQKLIANQSVSVADLKTHIRNNAAFRTAASEVGGDVYSDKLVDRLLKERTKTEDQEGVGLPGTYYSKEDSARHWSYLNDPKPIAGTLMCTDKQTMQLHRQKQFLDKRTPFTNDKRASSFHLKRAGEVSNQIISDDFNPDVNDKTVISEKLKENGLQTEGFNTYSGESIFEGLGAALAATGLPLNDIMEFQRHKQKQEYKVKGYDGRETLRAVQVSPDSPLIDYIDQYGDLYGLSITDENKPYRTIIYNGPTTPYDPTLKTLINANNCGINIDTKVDARVINAAKQNVHQTHGAFPFLHDGQPIWDLPEEQRHMILQEALEDRIIKDRQPLNNTINSYKRFNLKPQLGGLGI